jgi:nucleoid DNA-binding protein
MAGGRSFFPVFFSTFPKDTASYEQDDALTMWGNFPSISAGGRLLRHDIPDEANTLIKQDIIHHVIERTGLPRNKAEVAVDTVFESLKKALAAGDRIELRGFGVFNVRPRKTGIGRNPRTGAEVTITPGKAVRFKPGKELHLLDEEKKPESKSAD